MFDTKFNENLIQYSKEIAQLNPTEDKDHKNELKRNEVLLRQRYPDTNSFFGSYLSICKDSDEKFEKNPFFTEWTKLATREATPEKDGNWYNEQYKKNNSSSYFGAFTNHGDKLRCGIPSLQFSLNNKCKSADANTFQEEFEKYLTKYPNDITDYAFNNTIRDKTEEQQQNRDTIKNSDIIPLSLLSNTLFNKDYVNSQILKTLPQISNSQNKNSFYESNKIDETCFINVYKTINYDIALQNEYRTFFSALSQPLDLKLFYIDLIYLLQGIPSKTFYISDNFPFTFTSQSQNQLRLIGTIPDWTRNVWEFYIDFGTKMNLINFIIRLNLFSRDQPEVSLPYILKKFYSLVNDIQIQINEKILLYKKLLDSNHLTLIGLYNKITSLFPVINIIYSLLDLNNEFNNDYKGSIVMYTTFYNNNKGNLRSHTLLNSLFKIFNSFHSENQSYFLIKNLLFTSLKSYLFFILHLLLTGTIIDSNNEYFILQSNGNIALDNGKVPLFLTQYKNIILQNTVLINSIKAHDQGFYTVLSYKLSDIWGYIEGINWFKIDVDDIDNFILFKEQIFNQKIELIWNANDKLVNELEIVKNTERLRSLERISQMKKNDLKERKEEADARERIKEKKRKYYEEIMKDVIAKKERIENEKNKIKKENLEKLIHDRENELLKNEIITILKKKYEMIRQGINEEILYGGEKGKWKEKRKFLHGKRLEVFNAMNNESLFNGVYPVVERGGINDGQFHKSDGEVDIANYVENANEDIEMKEVENIEDTPKVEGGKVSDISQNGVYEGEKSNNSDNNNDRLSNGTKEQNMKDDIEMNDIAIDIQNINEDPINNSINAQNIVVNDQIISPNQSTPLTIKIKSPIDNIPSSPKISFPKFFISNIIYNDILLPIIDTALDISTQHQIKAKQLQQHTSHTKTSKEVDLEVSEILNKIIVITNENEDSNVKNVQIPWQILIQEFFQDIILKQYRLTNYSFVLMVKNKFNLIPHFDFFNNIFLCHSGDLILRYIENIFDFKTLSLNTKDPKYLFLQLKKEIEKKYISTLSFSDSYISGILDAWTLVPTSHLKLNYSLTNLEMAFKLSFLPEQPLDLIFNSLNIPFYDGIFKKLLKHNIYNQIIVRIYSVLKNQRNFIDNNRDNIQWLRITKWITDCYRVIKSVHGFIFNDIIDMGWMELRSKVSNSNDIYEIINSHNAYWNNINDILCNHPFMAVLDNLYFNISRFYWKSIIWDYFDFMTVKDDAVFNDIWKQLKRSCEKVVDYIRKEYVIGVFYNLKSYV